MDYQQPFGDKEFNMNIASLFLFVVGTIGMSHIIVDSSILAWFRTLVKNLAEKINVPKLGGIVDCYLCCGTWCGFFMGWVWISQNFWEIFACGCAGGFLSNLAAVFLNWIESATIVNLPTEDDNG
jgi:hypothetical protein